MPLSLVAAVHETSPSTVPATVPVTASVHGFTWNYAAVAPVFFFFIEADADTAVPCIGLRVLSIATAVIGLLSYGPCLSHAAMI